MVRIVKCNNKDEKFPPYLGDGSFAATFKTLGFSA